MKIFNGTDDLSHKYVENYDYLAKLVESLRFIKYKIVVTIGSWDLLHIGHVRYLRKARDQGDMLVVGVDSDKTVKRYKGEFRPIVPFIERCEMLTYQSCVDLVTKVDDVSTKGTWHYGLIKKLKPDIFVAVEDSYPKKQLSEIKKYVGKLVILPRQAEKTSTTRMVQHAVKKHLDKVYELLDSGRG